MFFYLPVFLPRNHLSIVSILHWKCAQFNLHRPSCRPYKNNENKLKIIIMCYMRVCRRCCDKIISIKCISKWILAFFSPFFLSAVRHASDACERKFTAIWFNLRISYLRPVYVGNHFQFGVFGFTAGRSASSGLALHIRFVDHILFFPVSHSQNRNGKTVSRAKGVWKPIRNVRVQTVNWIRRRREHKMKRE